MDELRAAARHPIALPILLALAALGAIVTLQTHRSNAFSLRITNTPAAPTYAPGVRASSVAHSRLPAASVMRLVKVELANGSGGRDAIVVRRAAPHARPIRLVLSADTDILVPAGFDNAVSPAGPLELQAGTTVSVTPMRGAQIAPGATVAKLVVHGADRSHSA